MKGEGEVEGEGPFLVVGDGVCVVKLSEVK